MAEPTLIGRYAIYDAIASGGMAVVHVGRFAGPAGFARTVAVKRMHPHLAREPEFVAMFLDEARLAARIRHPNVVSTLDVVATSSELLIVMDYVHGESLKNLWQIALDRKERIPVPIACAIAADLLSGLHAAHEAHDERGEPLRIVHRDVSPQNVLVGADGIARVLDFGVAKAVGRVQQTLEGQVKGKIAYMAPEQVRSGTVTRATDVYAASVVLWELLTGRRLFTSEREADIVEKILFGTIDAPSARASNIPEELNAVVLRGLAREPAERFGTARDMVRALREHVRFASASEVSDWVESVAGARLAERAATIAAIDRGRADDTQRLRAQPTRADEEAASEEQPAVVLPMEAIGTEATVLGVPSVVRARALRRRALWIGGALAALVGVGILAGRWPLRERASDAPGAAAATLPVAPSDEGSSAPSPALDPSGESPSTPSASASAVPSSTPPAAAAAAPTSRPHPGRPSQPASRAHARPGCSPPYTTDPDGTRHYKLQCL